MLDREQIENFASGPPDVPPKPTPAQAADPEPETMPRPALRLFQLWFPIKPHRG